jgi:hypothetical protein
VIAKILNNSLTEALDWQPSPSGEGTRTHGAFPEHEDEDEMFQEIRMFMIMGSYRSLNRSIIPWIHLRGQQPRQTFFFARPKIKNSSLSVFEPWIRKIF